MSLRTWCRRLPSRTPMRVFLWWVLVRTLVRAVFKILYRQRCLGRRNNPPTGPAIYVANHQSHLDPPIVGCLVGAFASMARIGLFSGIWKWVLTDLGAIPLVQERSDTRAMRTAVSVLRDGGRVLIYPEGARTRDGAVAPFLPGMMLLVRRSMAPVVLVALDGAYDVWPASRKYPHLSGRIASRVGRVVPAEELLAMPVGQAMERLRREIEVMRLELRADLRRRSRGRYPPPGLGDVPYWELPASAAERVPAAPMGAAGRHPDP